MAKSYCPTELNAMIASTLKIMESPGAWPLCPGLFRIPRSLPPPHFIRDILKGLAKNGFKIIII